MSLYICPTPIGNLRDITLRVLDILKSCDSILAEDTRVTRNLLNKYEISTPVISFHSYTKEAKLKRIVQELLSGKNMALVTDAGTPGISDPGYLLIRECIANGIKVEALPGPTSFVPALLLSGFPTDKFLFYGFLPRKTGKRRKIISDLKWFYGPIIFFESPYRVKSILEDILTELGDRPVAIARELTKIYEEVIRGKTSTVLAELANRTLKGEVIVVVGALESSAVEESSDDVDSL
ncbi:MAG: 16S rRNA (cytidine(1402)-2'-O)-methyltransferase [Caldisericaceae bacterium]